MRSLWNIDGGNLDVGYANLREARHTEERNIRTFLDAMWASYEPFADRGFRHGFARDPDARFWEMYLGCRLIKSGKTLLPFGERRFDGGPDICVLDRERRIWIEAIAPGPGEDGPDQVRGPVPIGEGGGAEYAPTRQAQLRMTSALLTKSDAFESYLQSGIVTPEDVRLIAIGVGRFGIYLVDRPLPTILSAVFPIGDQYVSIDRETLEVVDQGYGTSLEITRLGSAIPRTAFLDQKYAPISGISPYPANAGIATAG